MYSPRDCVYKKLLVEYTRESSWLDEHPFPKKLVYTSLIEEFSFSFSFAETNNLTSSSVLQFLVCMGICF